jgi:hypothetical protein
MVDAVIRGGQLRAQVVEPNGAVIPGFSFEDSVPVRSSGRMPVGWSAASGKRAVAPGLVDLRRLDGRSVRFEFRLDRAVVKGFDVDPGTPPPLRVGPGPHLLIDDFLLDSTEGVTRSMERAVPCPEPIVRGQPGALVAGGALTYSEERGVFRLWHWAGQPDVRTVVVHRESADPARWHGPGEIVYRHNGFGNKIVDDGPGALQPDRRFKLAYFTMQPPPLGMYVAFSADGLSWTPWEGNPVLPYYPPGHRRWTLGVGDIVDAFWDPIRCRYGAFVKLFAASDREFRAQSRTLRPGLGVRITGQTTSLDFTDWRQPWRVFVPDATDEGVTEFYGADVLARGDLLIAFLRVLRDDLAAEPAGVVDGIGYTVLATSRDGQTWQREREPFLDRGAEPGAHDRAVAWVAGSVLHDDRLYLVYGAYDTGHKRGLRHCGLAILPRDRFVARGAGRTQGRLATRSLIYTGKALPGLVLNTAAGGGRVRVQVRDGSGSVVPGFGFDDCEPVEVDALDAPVRFRRPLAELSGRPFRLEFVLRDAKLYAFSFQDCPVRG